MNSESVPFAFMDQCSKTVLSQLLMEQEPAHIALISLYKSVFEMTKVLDTLETSKRSLVIRMMDLLQSESKEKLPLRIQSALLFSNSLKNYLDRMIVSSPTPPPAPPVRTPLPSRAPPPFSLPQATQDSSQTFIEDTREYTPPTPQEETVDAAIRRIADSLNLELEKQILERLRSRLKSVELKKLHSNLEQSLEMLQLTKSNVGSSGSDQNK